MLSYYESALGRSWTSTWAWATGQGIYLTWLLGLGVLVAAVCFALIRAIRKHHSWSDAMKDARKAVQDFFFAMVISSSLALAVLFMVFFVQDAPTQLALANGELDALRNQTAKNIDQLTANNANVVSQLKAQIADLQSRLNDQDAQRRKHLEELQIRTDRVSTLANLIASGNQIAKTFEENNDRNLIKNEYLAWEQTTLQTLSTKFDVGYLTQFGSARGTGFVLMNHNIDGNGWYSLLEGKVNVLNSFLVELENNELPALELSPRFQQSATWIYISTAPCGGYGNFPRRLPD